MSKRNKTLAEVDLGQRPITYERVMKHERLIYAMIRKFFPWNQCFEASMYTEDLFAECVIQAHKALANFDPVQAIEKVTSNSKLKIKSDEERLQWKRENQEAALEKGESNWVAGRLKNYLQRFRWKNSPEFKGGRAYSFTAMLSKASTALNEDGSSRSIFDDSDESDVISSDSNQAFHQFSTNDTDQARDDFDELKFIQEQFGDDVMKEAYGALSIERKNDVISLCSMEQRPVISMKQSAHSHSHDIDIDTSVGDQEEFGLTNTKIKIS